MSDWALSASAAVAGLVTAGKTVIDNVHDSLVVTAGGGKEVIVVAGAVDLEAPTAERYIEHALDQPGMTPNVIDTFTVYSEVAVLRGSANVADARDRAYDIVRDWVRAINTDPTLGGAVRRAYARDVAYEARQTQRGATAVLTVSVECQTFTGR